MSTSPSPYDPIGSTSTSEINRAVMEGSECEVKHEGITESLKHRAAEAGERLKTMGATARESTRHIVDEARHRGGELLTQGRERAREMPHTLQSTIQQRPAAAIAVAAGIGFLLGFMLMREPRRRRETSMQDRHSSCR